MRSSYSLKHFHVYGIEIIYNGVVVMSEPLSHKGREQGGSRGGNKRESSERVGEETREGPEVYKSNKTITRLPCGVDLTSSYKNYFQLYCIICKQRGEVNKQARLF